MLVRFDHVARDRISGVVLFAPPNRDVYHCSVISVRKMMNIPDILRLQPLVNTPLHCLSIAAFEYLIFASGTLQLRLDVVNHNTQRSAPSCAVSHKHKDPWLPPRRSVGAASRSGEQNDSGRSSGVKSASFAETRAFVHRVVLAKIEARRMAGGHASDEDKFGVAGNENDVFPNK